MEWVMKLNQDNAIKLIKKAQEKLEALAIPKEKLGLAYDEKLDKVVIVNIDDYLTNKEL